MDTKTTTMDNRRALDVRLAEIAEFCLKNGAAVARMGDVLYVSVQGAGYRVATMFQAGIALGHYPN